MGLSHEERQALRMLRSRAQLRRLWREKKMNLFGELRPIDEGSAARSARRRAAAKEAR